MVREIFGQDLKSPAVEWHHVRVVEILEEGGLVAGNGSCGGFVYSARPLARPGFSSPRGGGGVRKPFIL
eukprot:5921938-Pyramimonas_sp.AAC.1